MLLQRLIADLSVFNKNTCNSVRKDLYIQYIGNLHILK